VYFPTNTIYPFTLRVTDITRKNDIVECLDYQIPVTQETNFKINITLGRGEEISMFKFFIHGSDVTDGVLATYIDTGVRSLQFQKKSFTCESPWESPGTCPRAQVKNK